MTVLGIDPGLATVGYGVVRQQGSRFLVQDYGILSTPAKTPLPTRLSSLYRALQDLIDTAKPDQMAVEELFFNRNVTTAFSVAHARGVLLLAGQSRNLPMYEYTPLQIKQSVCGYGRADKSQMQQMVQRLLGLKEIPKPDDAADALGIALCHLNTARFCEQFRI